MNHLFLQNNHFLFYQKFKKFSFLTMSKVKIDHILPKLKNATIDFFEYPIVSDRLTRKLIRNSKNVGGKLTYFCLGSKT